MVADWSLLGTGRLKMRPPVPQEIPYTLWKLLFSVTAFTCILEQRRRRRRGVFKLQSRFSFSSARLSCDRLGQFPNTLGWWCLCSCQPPLTLSPQSHHRTLSTVSASPPSLRPSHGGQTCARMSNQTSPPSFQSAQYSPLFSLHTILAAWL